jgi:phosphohistidine phosphatase
MSVKLYLIQHAKAAPAEIDPDRSLTKEGLRDIRKVAEFIKPLNLHVEYLWHSGKKRAEQTAEVLAEAIKVNKNMTARDGLGPNDDVTALAHELAAAKEDIAIVGHLPFLAKLASLLLIGSESANTVAFKNGGIVCLARSDDNQWQINWMVIPELLG